MRLGAARVGELTHFAGEWGSARLTSWLTRYGFACALVLAAFALRYAVALSTGHRLELTFFITAALCAAWYGGVGPGLFALVAGFLLAGFYFMPPSHSFALRTRADIIIVSVYVGATAIGIAMIENLHRARRRCELLLRQNIEHTRVEETLRQSEERFREMADAMPQMVWASHQTERLEYANRKWFEYTGLSEEQTYRPGVWLLVLHPADKDRSLKVVRSALQNGQPFQIENRIKNRFGIYRWHLTRALPTKDPSGHLIQWFATSTDIEEQKQAEAALEAAREQLAHHARDLESRVVDRTAKLQESIHSLEGVLYHVAHDLRAPLRAMEGFTQLLLEHHAASFDTEGVDYGRRIIDASKRMDELIHDLLAYGRLTHMEVACRRLDLETQVDWVLAEMASEIKARHANIFVEKPLPPVWANAAVLNQILTNLLSNALKFVSPNVVPSVQISGERSQGRVLISVQDNGIGIEQAHYEKIFHVFGRLHGANVYPGTGIGLAIARKGAERMNGIVRVESHPGQGSRFLLELPSAPVTA